MLLLKWESNSRGHKPDNPQLACYLTPESPESSLWTSDFFPERRLRARMLLNRGGSDHETAVFLLGGGFFSETGRPDLPLLFSLGVDRCHAHRGGARSRRRCRRSDCLPLRTASDRSNAGSTGEAYTGGRCVPATDLTESPNIAPVRPFFGVLRSNPGTGGRALIIAREQKHENRRDAFPRSSPWPACGPMTQRCGSSPRTKESGFSGFRRWGSGGVRRNACPVRSMNFWLGSGGGPPRSGIDHGGDGGG